MIIDNLLKEIAIVLLYVLDLKILYTARDFMILHREF